MRKINKKLKKLGGLHKMKKIKNEVMDFKQLLK